VGNEKFIKDTGNLLHYNIWSCGDYNENVIGFENSSGTTLQITKDLSINGDHCLQCTVNGNTNSRWFRYFFDNPNNVNLSWKISIINPSPCDLFVTQYLNENTSDNLLLQVRVPPSDEWIEHTLSVTLNEECTKILLHVSFYGDTNENCYSDQWILNLD